MSQMNPQLGAMLQNPQIRAMMTNPAFLQQLANPAAMQVGVVRRIDGVACCVLSMFVA
jgi:hypothetical protein